MSFRNKLEYLLSGEQASAVLVKTVRLMSKPVTL